MQEVAVALKDAIYIHAGPSSVSWRDLCVTASVAAFSLARLETFRDGMLACCLELHFVVMKDVTLRRRGRLFYEDGSVVSSQTALKNHVLVYLKGLHATNPRDKVYAILFALARRSPRDANEMDPDPSDPSGIHQEITVDYTKPAETVFTEFTTFIPNHAEGPYTCAG